MATVILLLIIAVVLAVRILRFLLRALLLLSVASARHLRRTFRFFYDVRRTVKWRNTILTFSAEGTV
jgi:hypothetical protein